MPLCHFQYYLSNTKNKSTVDAKIVAGMDNSYIKYKIGWTVAQIVCQI